MSCVWALIWTHVCPMLHSIRGRSRRRRLSGSRNIQSGLASLTNITNKRLFALVNELHDAMRQHSGQAALAATLNELICSARVHFGAEEVLMEAFGYPGKPAAQD